MFIVYNGMGFLPISARPICGSSDLRSVVSMTQEALKVSMHIFAARPRASNLHRKKYLTAKDKHLQYWLILSQERK